MQETFVRVYQYLPKSKKDLPFKPWLFQICVNLCRNLAKKKKSLPFTSLESKNDEGEAQSFVEKISDKNPTPHKEIKKKEVEEEVKKAVKKLPDKFKEVITLRYYEDLPYDEISTILKLPLNTVRTHLRRAKERLQKILRPYC